MKTRLALLALSAIALAGCAEAPQAAAPSLAIVFQADTAQTPDHIAECVYQAFKGKPSITIGDDQAGGMAITVTGPAGVQAVLSFARAASGTHVSLRQDPALARDAFGLIKRSRVCGAMTGS
jgi:hypothetical protein